MSSQLNLKKIFYTLFLSLLLLSLTQVGWAKATFPEPTGYVNDYVGILSSQQKQTLTNAITELEEKTSAEVAIAVVESIDPYDIEQYAVKLFEKWAIGVKEKDNGVLIVLALQERSVRIEVGYGLEGILPDGLAGEIIRSDMIPFFKEKNYAEGLIQGTRAVIKQVAKEYQVDITGLPSAKKPIHQKDTALGSLLEFIFLILFFILVFGFKSGLLGFFLFGPRGGGYWGSGGGGGFGGGFGGFGGGSSGGGGASGRW